MQLGKKTQTKNNLSIKIYTPTIKLPHNDMQTPVENCKILPLENSVYNNTREKGVNDLLLNENHYILI